MREDTIATYLQGHIMKECGVPGCDIIVARDHRVLYQNHFGVGEKQLFYLYSTTKPLTVTTALRLYEDGLLDVDAPVANYLPAFRNLMCKEGDTLVPVETPLTVRHLFTMTGGFDYDLYTAPTQAVLSEKGEDASTLDIVNSLAKKPLHFEPGTALQYSLCHDVLAGVVETVAGKRFSDYMQEIILDPLGMTHTTFRDTPEVHDQIADQYLFQDGKVVPYNKRNDLVPSPNYDSGGAGLISCGADYIKFADTLACGGISKDGYRLLKPETISFMASEQLSGFEMNNDYSGVAGVGYGYGMGVRVKIAENGGLSPLGEFGWDGAAGCYCLMDPINHLSIFFGMQVLGWPHCIGTAHYEIRDIVYKRFV